MSNIRLNEIFISDLEFDEFLTSISRMMNAYCDYMNDQTSKEKMDGFCRYLGEFIIINADELKCLLNFYEPKIQEYQKYKEKS